MTWAGRSDPASVGEAIYDLLTTDLRDDVKTIRTPVLLIGAAKAFAGDPDRLRAATMAYADQVAAVPDHKIEMAANALHFIMFDDPQFLLRAMDDFLGAGGHRDAR